MTTHYDSRPLSWITTHIRGLLYGSNRNSVERIPFTLYTVRGQTFSGLRRGALESGRLSGKYFDQAPNFSEEDIRSISFAGENFRKYDSYSHVIPAGVSMTAFALRYLLDLPTTHSIILGGKTVGQYKESLKAVDMPPLDPEILKEIEKIRARLTKVPLKRRVYNRALRAASRLTNRAGN